MWNCSAQVIVKSRKLFDLSALELPQLPAMFKDDTYYFNRGVTTMKTIYLLAAAIMLSTSIYADDASVSAASPSDTSAAVSTSTSETSAVSATPTEAVVGAPASKATETTTSTTVKKTEKQVTCPPKADESKTDSTVTDSSSK